MESKKLLVSNIPEGKVIQIIRAKPVNQLFFTVAFGVAMIFSGLGKVIQVSGMFILVLAVFCLAFLPERRLISFYKNYMIIYNEIDRSYCNLLYYDEILSYRYIKGRRYDVMAVEMVDESVYEIPCYSKGMVTTFMREFAKDKEVVNNSRLLGR